jgi:hypothetical protein
VRGWALRWEMWNGGLGEVPRPVCRFGYGERDCCFVWVWPVVVLWISCGFVCVGVLGICCDGGCTVLMLVWFATVVVR